MPEIDKKQKFALFKPDGGMRPDIPSWGLAANQAADLKNCFYNIKTKFLEKAPGYLEGVIDAVNFYCGALGNDVLTDLVYKTIVASGAAHLCYINGGGLTEIATDLPAYDGTSNMRFVGFGDYVIFNPVSKAGNLCAYLPSLHTIAILDTGPITSINPTPTAPGATYVVGDVLAVATGSGDAHITVKAVDGGGGVTQLELTTGGTGGYTAGAGVATIGHGDGNCTVEIWGAQSPDAFAIAAKWGKIFAVNGRTIFWSNTWDHTTWDAINTQTVGNRDDGDVRQMVEMACCLYIFCQKAVYKMYYVGGDAFVYCELIDTFDSEFIPGSATCVHNKKIYFATKAGIYYTDGLNVYEYDEGNRAFLYEYADIADDSDITWYLRQAFYYEPLGLYLLPIKTGDGVFGDADCNFKTIVLDIVNGGMYVWDWDFYAINKSRAIATTGSDMIMLSAQAGNYAATGLDNQRVMAMSGYNFNGKNYDSYYQTGLIPLDGAIDTDKMVSGVETIVQSTGNYNLTIQKGDEKGLDPTTYALALTGFGAIYSVAAAPTAGGTGYHVNDVLTVLGGSADATVTVAAIGGGGASGPVTGIILTTPGAGLYTIGTGKATSGGTGTGCTISITAIVEGSIIGKNTDFVFTSKLFQLKFSNNTKDQNYKVLGCNINWTLKGETRRVY